MIVMVYRYGNLNKGRNELRIGLEERGKDSRDKEV